MRRISFQHVPDEPFWTELKTNVENYFQEKNTSPYANGAMWLKMIVMLLLFAVPYVLICTMQFSGIVNWLLCLVMGIAMAGIGFCISHQAAHNAVSKKSWVNRALSLSFNLVGMSDYIWKIKHNVYHHAYTNVYELDEALKEGDLLRLSHDAPYKRVHRWQHIYGALVYGVFTVFWAFALDFEKLFRYNGHGSRNPESKHPVSEVLLFVFTKIYYVFIAFILPHYFFGFTWGEIVTGFLTVHVVASSLITHVLQVEHLSEETELVSADESGRVPKTWAVNQLEGTCNFRTNKIFDWYIGGCNYQVEHHLFPTICTIHYPALSRIVEATAKKHGLRYVRHDSFGAALRSHYRLLRTLGQAPQIQPALHA